MLDKDGKKRSKLQKELKAGAPTAVNSCHTSPDLPLATIIYVVGGVLHFYYLCVQCSHVPIFV